MQVISSGKGTIGLLLNDTMLPNSMEKTIRNVNQSTYYFVEISEKMNGFIKWIDKDKGSMNMLLTDTAIANLLKQSMINLQAGTDNFNQNRKALKNSFLFRSYFRDLEKK